MKKTILLLSLSYIFCINVLAQSRFPQEPITVKYTTEKIKIDGLLEEPIWQTAQSGGAYYQYFPSDTLKSKHPTDIYFAFDDKNLYLAARCHTIGRNYVITSNRRDYRAGSNDNLSFVFDTFDDKTNAFLFGMNAIGVMREALIYNGGSDNEFFNTFWDNKWQGATSIGDSVWVCEMAIPFSTLRYKEGATQWNFMSYRFDTQTNETSSYVRIPQNQLIFNLAFTVPMIFEKPLKKTGANISLIPYVAARNQKDFERKNPADGAKLAVGGDAKIGITSGLNLDLTINPDFSNVEADRQVTNLTRFDITYPEQRQFFLENSDLFTGYGNNAINPFFSRRIGIAQDTVAGISVQNAIQYGARLSGKINNNWRVGLLNTQTAKDIGRGIPATNFSVAALQRKIFNRSNIAAIFVDKENLNPEVNPKIAKFNRVAGLDYNIATVGNRWEGKVFYHKSFTPNDLDKGFAHGANIIYRQLKYEIGYAHDWVGKGYNAEVGFVPRGDYFRIKPRVRFNFYPRTRLINRHYIGVEYEQYSNAQNGVTDKLASLLWAANLQSSARCTLSLNQNYTYLFSNFDALRSNGKKPSLLRGSEYDYFNVSASYLTDMRKKVVFSLISLTGQYFNGNIISLATETSYRYQPYGSIALNATYNRIHLSTGKNNIYLIGPRVDLTFTKNIFWTTFVQYNSQFDNLNINSRFQWRYAPVSDFFLVFTNNRGVETNFVKNRAIFAKLIYWFNV
jgi:hypothetical protein